MTTLDSLSARSGQSSAEIERQSQFATAKDKGWRRFFEPNYNVNYSARLYYPHYEEVWDKERAGHPEPRWLDSLGGRCAIRLFSRGIMGAGFLSLGNHILAGYNPASSMTELEKLAQTPLNRGLNGIAKVYDVSFGVPIRAILGENAGTFRTSRTFGSNGKMGRNYGEEAVAVTLDFALGSIGDAWGRNIAGIFDPNVKKSWLHDGRVDFKDLAKSTAKSALHILSFNQMEDWFAAIPYVYQMRAQRSVLNHFRPGTKLMLEHGFNGGGVRIDSQGAPVGDYALPGAVDLQLRFMGYNVYTLMFRDMYNHVKSKFSHRHDEEKPIHERGMLGEGLKYLVKTGIKANLYMAPAVPFFWAFRTSHGMLDEPRIFSGPHPDTGQHHEGVVFADGAQGAYRQQDRYNAPGNLRVGLVPNDPSGFNLPASAQTHFFDTNAKPFEHTKPAYGWFARTLQPLGRLQGKIGSIAGNAVSGAILPHTLEAIDSPHDPHWKKRGQIHMQAQRFVNNSMSYTPYMIAKYETANLWDTPQMDAALYRMIDGVAQFKTSEIKAGLHDVGNVMRRLPVSVQTELMTHEPRGLVNSTQQSRDADDKRDGHIVKSFAEVQLENKLERLRRERETGQTPRQGGIEIRDTAHETPSPTVVTRGKSGQQAYQLSQLTPDRPAGATIH